MPREFPASLEEQNKNAKKLRRMFLSMFFAQLLATLALKRLSCFCPIASHSPLTAPDCFHSKHRPYYENKLANENEINDYKQCQ